MAARLPDSESSKTVSCDGVRRRARVVCQQVALITRSRVLDFAAIDPGVELRLRRQELRCQPSEDVIHDRLGKPYLGIAGHAGEARTAWLNLSTSAWSGTPYCRAYEMAWANASAKPEIVDPSLAITRKISPGWPSSNNPTVMYLSCPAISNLWVMALRSSGSLRRTGPPLIARPVRSRSRRRLCPVTY